MCMFQCPVYSVHRCDAYSSKGKINAIDSIINTKQFTLPEVSEIFRECNLCRHCAKICPGEIDTPDLVIKYREQLNKIKPFNNYEQILNNINQTGNPYTDIKKNNVGTFKKENKDCKTLLFLGCTIRYKLPKKIVDSVLIFLDNLGMDYTIIDDEPCCGNILNNLGYIQEAQIIAKKNRNILSKFDRIITLCPGCYNMFKSNKRSNGKEFEVFHILEILQIARNLLKSNIKEPIYFQVPCHIYNCDKKFEKIIPDVLILFEQVSSSLDVTKNPKCCGAGGGMLSSNKDYVEKRINILVANETADKVITACPFCYLNFEKNTSKDVYFITENLDVSGKMEIDLKSNNRIFDSNGENHNPAPTQVILKLIQYKVNSKIEKILSLNK